MIAWPSMRKNANSWLEKNYNVLSPYNVIEFLLGQKAKSFFLQVSWSLLAITLKLYEMPV